MSFGRETSAYRSWIRPEAQRRTGLFFRDVADDLEFAHPLAVLEVHAVDLAVAADRDFDTRRQRIDDRHADAVQAAGEPVVLVREFSAGVQPRQDQFDARNAFLRMDVDWHAAAIVADLDRAVRVQRDLDRVRMPGERFVDRVVDDLLGQVIGTRRVRVHARAALDRLQTGEDLDIGGVIATAHAGKDFPCSLCFGRFASNR